MLFRAQRRIHLQIRGERLHALVAEGDVVRRDLAGDADAGGARVRAPLDRAGRREMRDVHVRAGQRAPGSRRAPRASPPTPPGFRPCRGAWSSSPRASRRRR